MKIDGYGLVTAGTDSADSLQRTFSVYMLITMNLHINANLNYLANAEWVPEIARPAIGTALFEPNNDGEYIRSPQPAQWSSDPTTVSRDQLTPVICYYAYMIHFGQPSAKGRCMSAMNRLVKACLKRGMFAQNWHSIQDDGSFKWKVADFLTPDLWAIMARAYLKTLWAPIAYPVMYLGDAFSILSTLTKVFLPRTPDGALWPLVWNDPNAVDDTNINNCIMACQFTRETYFSILARKIYKRFRKSNYGNMGKMPNIEPMEDTPVMGAIAWYNRNDNPEITTLSRPLVERY